MESVAPRHDLAAQLPRLAVVAVADERLVGVDVDRLDVERFEHDRAAGRETGGDEVLDDLLLAVHGDRAADELDEVDVVAAALEGELDATMREAHAVETLRQAEVAQELDGRGFEHAGADAVLDVLAVAELEHDALDPPFLEQVGEHESGRSGTDDADLGLVGDVVHAECTPVVIVACSSRSTASSSAVGGGTSSISSATARFHPVASRAWSTVAPGCSAPRVSSHVRGSG